MKKFLCFFSVILALFTIFALSSCGENGGQGAIFVVDRKNIQMSVGDVYTVSWTVIPTPDEATSVSWKSSDDSIVTCEGGVVRAVGEGKAIVTATHSSGMYEVISVTVENDNNRLFMIEGESFHVKNADINTVIMNAECISSDVDIATVTKSDDGVVINAIKTGKCDVRLETENASAVYYNLFVLSSETAGVNVKTEELPMTVNYDSGRYQSAVKITNVNVEKTFTREMLDAQTVLVAVTFEFEKIYDSDGNDALNPTEFMIIIYSDEANSDAPIRELEVHSGWISVESGEEKSYTYLFYADFELGSGIERNYTFTIKEIEGKE